MLSPTEKKNFVIETEDSQTFYVKVFLGFDESTDEQLPLFLREIKSAISHRYSIPSNQLRYERLTDKQSHPDGFTAIMEIRRLQQSQGQPVFKFCSMALPNGRMLDNMTLMIDIFHLDAGGRKIKYSEVKAQILNHGVLEKFIDEEALKLAVEKVLKEKITLEDLLSAKGIPPDTGADAELEFKFLTNAETVSLDDYIDSRKAKNGDILCRKIPRKSGENKGYDLFGNEIPPINGRDFTLQAGRGTKLSPDGNKIIADENGIVIVRSEEMKMTSMGYSHSFPKEVQIRIDPLTVVESSRTVEIVSRKSVEVQGDLRENSSIITEGEVYVQGNVGPNVKIHAGDDIVVAGDVVQGTLVSSKNILVKANLTDSTLSAKEYIRVEGVVKNSTVYGKEVSVDTFYGSKLVAGRKAVVRQVEADESNVISEIRVGMNEFYRMKIDENREFVGYSKKSLEKMCAVLGKNITDELNYSNLELMFLRFVSTKGRKQGLSNEQLEASKSLMESVPSLKVVINEKEEEISRLEAQLDKKTEIPGLIIITERINAPVSVQINSITTQLPPGEAGEFGVVEDKITGWQSDIPGNSVN